MKTVFIRAIEADIDGKAAVLRQAARASRGAASLIRFDLDPHIFSAIPKSPFAYWTSEALRASFKAFPSFETESRHARLGASSKNDFRFLRLWFESMGDKWCAFAKGGKQSKYYADIYLLILWENGAHQIESELDRKYPYLKGNFDFVLHRELPYGCPGLTWPRRTNGLSFRVMPAGCIFGDKGPAVFVDDDDPVALLGLCAIVNSRAFAALVAVQLARTELAQSYEVGLIQRTPVPDLAPAEVKVLAGLAMRSWALKRALDTRAETSHAFTLPALLQVDGETLSARAESWRARHDGIEAELAALQAEIDDRCFALYGIDDDERARIERGFGDEAGDAGEPDDEDADEGADEAEAIDAVPMIETLLSWVLGAALGRFDLRLVTGARALPEAPAPFDPLPPCSPGMLTGEDRLPCVTAPEGYPIALPEEGVLVDDPGHPQDIMVHVRAVFDVVFGEKSSERLLEAEHALCRPNEELRAWFARRLFSTHVTRYSRSRRSAPIYWQLATPSGSYSVWCYCHRMTADSLFRIARDHVSPKVAHEEDKLSLMRREAGLEPSREQRKALDAQERFVAELHAMEDEVKRVAPLWSPNLDDGILIHFALLWRLVPHDKPWQKQCEKTWDKLREGDYDWSHLAMHLWPERVVLTCTKDRSVAIAHGLDDVLWYQDAEGKWKPREVDDAQIDELVSARSSSAVKDALQQLAAASAPGGSARRRGRKRGGA